MRMSLRHPVCACDRDRYLLPLDATAAIVVQDRSSVVEGMICDMDLQLFF